MRKRGCTALDVSPGFSDFGIYPDGRGGRGWSRGLRVFVGWSMNQDGSRTSLDALMILHVAMRNHEPTKSDIYCIAQHGSSE